MRIELDQKEHLLQVVLLVRIGVEAQHGRHVYREERVRESSRDDAQLGIEELRYGEVEIGLDGLENQVFSALETTKEWVVQTASSIHVNA